MAAIFTISGPPSLVFLTSVTGSGNFGSWADAGGTSGLAAADAICQARATAAGLPGRFRAWVSDQSDDAYCRVHGLTGKKAASCGQAQLPAFAGPWVRPDGFPFATLDQLVSGVAYTPLYFDETRTAVPRYTYAFTGSNRGVLDPSNTTPCSNWTAAPSTPPGVAKGGAESPYKWEVGVVDVCSSVGNLICFQQGAGGPLPPVTSTGKRVFVTSQVGTGSLATWSGAGGRTGVAAGDAICRSLATSAGLSGTYVAWLSDATTSAASHLASNGPWVRVDGVKVAASKADLTSGAIFTAIMVTETGGLFYGTVWTGTSDTGATAAPDCAGWTSPAAADGGTWGNPVFVMGWSAVGSSQACNSTGALYCFEE